VISTSHVEYAQYELIEDVEDLRRYRPGGYHPIEINQSIHAIYRVIDKLGCGSYSAIWLARDEKLSNYVAITIGTADSNEKKVDILTSLGRSSPALGKLAASLFLPVLDRFSISGPNGIHPSFVTLPAGGSLSTATSNFGLFQLQVARSISAQLAFAVAYIHEFGYIHGGGF
jgi:serine/threonine-protein kinase SRPK3